MYGNESFIADVGGYLGLLLGASLLSLIEELIEAFTKNCCGKYRKTYDDSPKIEMAAIADTDSSPKSRQ